ncbi:hypothetical protein VTI74DRAFT_4118 [Chaetomium olivicolor]
MHDEVPHIDNAADPSRKGETTVLVVHEKGSCGISSPVCFSRPAADDEHGDDGQDEDEQNGETEFIPETVTEAFPLAPRSPTGPLIPSVFPLSSPVIHNPHLGETSDSLSSDTNTSPFANPAPGSPGSAQSINSSHPSVHSPSSSTSAESSLRAWFDLPSPSASPAVSLFSDHNHSSDTDYDGSSTAPSRWAIHPAELAAIVSTVSYNLDIEVYTAPEADRLVGVDTDHELSDDDESEGPGSLIWNSEPEAGEFAAGDGGDGPWYESAGSSTVLFTQWWLEVMDPRGSNGAA